MFQWLLYFAFILGLLPISILKYKKKLITVETYFITPFLWLVFVATLYEWICTKILKIPTTIWFRVYLLLEFLALLYYFYHLLKKQFKIFFGISFVLYTGLFVFLLPSLSGDHYLKADAYLSIVETVFVYVCVVLWFINIFQELTEHSLLHVPHFYFISGFLMYFSGTLFLYLMGDLLLYSSSISFEAYWNLSIIFNIILRVLLIIGAWRMR